MSKKILAIFLTISLVFSCLPVVGIAFAEQSETNTAKFVVTSQNYATLGEQNGWSVTFEKNSNGVTKEIPTNWYSGERLSSVDDATITWALTKDGVTGGFSALSTTGTDPQINTFDGNLGTKADFKTNANMVSGSGSTAQNSYAFDGNYQNTIDFVIEFADDTDISGILLASYDKHSTGAYRMYASDNRSTLFNGDPIIDYESSNIGNTTVAHIYKLNPEKTVTAKFVGVRVAAIQAKGYVGNDYYLNCLRLSELAIFGHTHNFKRTVVSNNKIKYSCVSCGAYKVKDISTAKFDVTNENYQTLSAQEGWNVGFSTNVLNNTNKIFPDWYSGDIISMESTTSISWYTTTAGVRSAGNSINNKKEPFDGVMGTKADFTNKAMANSGSNAYGFDGNYVNTIDYVMDFGAPSEISGLLVAAYGTHSVGAYSIYVSNNGDDIFNGKPVITYESSTLNNSNTAAHIFKLEEHKRFTTRYIGVRVAAVQPKGYSSGNTYVETLRISELAVFGTLGESEYYVTGSTITPTKYAETVAMANSLIADKDPVLKNYTNTTVAEDDVRYSAGDKDVNILVSNSSSASGVGYSPTNSKNISTAGNVLVGNNGQVNFAYKDSNDNWQVYNDASKMSVRVGYYLGGPSVVSEVSNYFHHNANGTTYKYRLSFANTAADLFSDSAVYNTNVITNVSYNYNMSVKLNKEVIAKYVGIEIISGITPVNPAGYGTVNSYARMAHIDVFGTPVENVKTVSVVDEHGDVIYKTWTDNDFIDEDAINEIDKFIPSVFGYKYYGLDTDLTAPITADTVVNTIYKRDVSLIYNVTYIPCGQTEGETKEISFDSRYEITDNAATTFKSGDAVIGVPGNATIYVGGDITISGSTDAAPSLPSIAILNYTAESGTLRTFAHAYVPEGFTVNKIGAVVVTGTVNDLFTDSDWTIESLAAKNKRFINEYLYKNGRDFMFTLQGINAGVRRYAKSYIEYTNGNTTGIAYSNVVLYSSVQD